MSDRAETGVAVRSARRRRIRPVEDERAAWVADDLLLDPTSNVSSSVEPDRAWCLPSAGEQQGQRWENPIWRLLDRWSRPGSVTVRGGAADVYRVVRLPAAAVRASVEQLTDLQLVAGKSSLVVSRVGSSRLRGVIAPAGSRRAHVEITFERWNQTQLCAHLRPVGRSSGRAGSAAWWSAAHAVLDELVARLTHFNPEPLSQ